MSSNSKEVKNINWFPGHMKKATDNIKANLKLVDFVIELLDSRIPYSSQNEYIEQILKDKKRLFLLTKKDLSDENQTKMWIDKLNNEGNKCIAVDLKNNKDYDLIFEKIVEFCREKDEKYKKKGIKNLSNKILIVGIPNVGKSTLINFLAKKSITNTANKPGVTKNLRWVKVNNFEFLDTPGILAPQFEDKNKALNLSLIGSIKETVLPKEDLIKVLIDFLKKYYKEEFANRYNLDNLDMPYYLILEKICENRRLLQKNNEFFYEKAIDVVLNEYKNGTICKFTLDRIEDANIR